MTDAELIKAAAERAMGWRRQVGELEGTPVMTIREPSWNPLNSDADAFMLVDALAARGMRFLLEYRQPLRGGPPEWVVRFGDGELVTDPDRRRAIVVGALKACEVAVEA